jgi:argininosuccinate lyase
VHHFVEKQLTQAIGETGLKLHTGRSRNEQIATDLRLFVRRSCRNLTGALEELIAALLTQARRAGEAAMPAYTHLQRAEPVLVAHWLLAYCEMFFRDIDRLADCAARLNYCPLGSGAIAGATLRLDRELMTRELDFSAPTANSLDATSDRDFCLEFTQALSIVTIHLSRLAEEFILFSTQEYGFITLPESYSTGSSAMPQKQNPDSLELIRGKCGRVVGCLTGLMVTMKGLPMTYNRDMQEDKVPLFEAADQLAGSLEMARAVIASVKLLPAIPAAAAAESWVVATDLAEALARAGTPFHQAHRIVGRFVLESVRSGRKPADWTPAEMRRFAPEFTEEMAGLLDPARGMESREVPGGTGPATVAAALKEAHRRLAEMTI